MKTIFPPKLKKGNEVRVVAPSRSISVISDELKAVAKKRFDEMGLELSFGKHIEESDEFMSSSIESRIGDIHDAFKDTKVNAILTVLGGFNCNQLLRYLDWQLIKNNPKIFCGFSDITALNNAILTKTGLVTYSGPHYSTFGQELYFEYTLEYFKKCLFSEKPINILPSEKWSDDAWYRDQQKRKLEKNSGYLAVNEGETSGIILGANIGTFNLLQGTEYFPDLTDSILFLEDDEEASPHAFDRILQSLIHQPNFDEVKGIVMGRFQKVSEMTDEVIIKIIKTKKELNDMPIVANVDFGHTDPKITFPIGGSAAMNIVGEKVSLEINKH